MAFQTPSRFSATDFSTMLKTPSRPAGPGAPAAAAAAPAAAASDTPAFGRTPGFGGRRVVPKPVKAAKAPSFDFMPPPAAQKRSKLSVTAALERRAKLGIKVGPDATPYRDRAAERELGVNRDYENDAKLAETVGLRLVDDAGDVAATPSLAARTPQVSSGLGSAASTPFSSAQRPGSIPNPAAVGEEERALQRQQQIDEAIRQSKLLGGDEKFTHLVKGLDTELLQKRKAQLREEMQAREEKGAAKEQRQQKAERKERERARHRATGERLQCELSTPLGRSIYQAVCAPRAAGPAALGEGRTALVFGVGDGHPGGGLLRMVSAAATGQASRGTLLNAGCREDTLRSVAAVIARRATGAYGAAGRSRRSAITASASQPAPQQPDPAVTLTGRAVLPQAAAAAQPPAAAPAAGDSDGSGSDIFAGAGKYDPDAASDKDDESQRSRERRRRRRSRSRRRRRRDRSSSESPRRRRRRRSGSTRRRRRAGSSSSPRGKPPPRRPPAVRFEDVEEERRREQEEADNFRAWIRSRQAASKRAAKHGGGREADADADADTGPRTALDDRGAAPAPRPEQLTRRPRRGGPVDDGYAECFPDTWAAVEAAGVAAGALAVSDDDEEDGKGKGKGKKADSKQSSRQLRRAQERMEKMKLDSEHQQLMRHLEKRAKGGDPAAKRPRLAEDDD
eukprot:TRINITY_DN8818_c0_g1_i1.p1 TRINITY_DN8818_c0_g1~~TRINITY_DN8818_c0_g1_i1.p1  ORF type:complete len:714 (+),score=205.51 TRINITY_DN8818_c0_g1_i1:105-2144(+)